MNQLHSWRKRRGRAFSQRNYGMEKCGDLFTGRQSLALRLDLLG